MKYPTFCDICNNHTACVSIELSAHHIQYIKTEDGHTHEIYVCCSCLEKYLGAFDQYHQRGKYAPKPRIVWCCESAKTSNILDFDGKAFFLVGSSDEIIEYCPWCATELRRCICK